MPEFETILYEVDDRVATITLNRPERLNAFNSQMLRDVMDAIDVVDADDDVRAVIFTGAGRGYCAGADLSGMPLVVLCNDPSAPPSGARAGIWRGCATAAGCSRCACTSATNR